MKKTKNVKLLKSTAQKIRRDIIKISHKANVGHIGSSLSITDILTVIYCSLLNIDPKNPKNPLRDRFILSKGHAALALYLTLQTKGFFSKELLKDFCKDNGSFGYHPEFNLSRGIELSTGSLGHGLPIGTGMALGLKKLKNNRKSPKVFVLISDAELNEGSTWEAIMFAGHHKLDNLIVVIDDNGYQAFGRTKEIINIQPISEKWKMFGWEVLDVDGHNITDLLSGFETLLKIKDKPKVLIAKTTAGKGVSFMEDKLDWHYLTVDKILCKKALKEIF